MAFNFSRLGNGSTEPISGANATGSEFLNRVLGQYGGGMGDMLGGIINKSPFGKKLGASQPQGYQPADTSGVPTATGNFNSQLDPSARRALVQTMIQRSRNGGNPPAGA